MTNLAGHDLPSLLEAFERVTDDRRTCFIVYTIKGYGLPLQGHKENHAGLMTTAQMELFRNGMNIRAEQEWDPFEGLETDIQMNWRAFSLRYRSTRREGGGLLLR